MFSTVVAWIQANPVLVVPIAGALASLFYNKLNSYPRIHAGFSALAAAGVDLPKLIAMLQKMITGKDPRPPPSGPVGSLRTAPTVPPAAKPPSVQRTTIGDWAFGMAIVGAVGVVVAVFAAFVSGCALLKGSTLPSDLEKNYACVQGQIENGVTNFMKLEEVCLPGQLGTIVDIVETLVASSEFAAAHPAVMPALKEGVVGARASFARDK